MRRISRRHFHKVAGPERLGFLLPHREIAWFSHRQDWIVGAVGRRGIGDDFGFLVLGRDAEGRFRPLRIGARQPSFNAAVAAVRRAFKEVASGPGPPASLPHEQRVARELSAPAAATRPRQGAPLTLAYDGFGTATMVNVTMNFNGNVGVVGNVERSSVTLRVGSGQMAQLAHALRALARTAEGEANPTAVAVSAIAHRAANEASSSTPEVSRLERLILGTAAVVQGVASLGPAWSAVTTEAAKLGLKLALPGAP